MSDQEQKDILDKINRSVELQFNDKSYLLIPNMREEDVKAINVSYMTLELEDPTDPSKRLPPSIAIQLVIEFTDLGMAKYVSLTKAKENV